MEMHSDIFQTRLKAAIAPENLKQWCARVDIPLSTITGAAQRKAVPTGSTLLEVSKATGCSIDWLLGLTDQQHVLAAPSLDVPVIGCHKPSLAAEDWSDFVQVPMYAVKASAGHGAFVDQEKVKYHLAFRREFITMELQIAHNKLYCVEVDGISMEPVLRHSHPALIEVFEDQALREGPHLLLLEGALLLKNLQRLPGGRLRIWSENQSTNAYQPIELDWPPRDGVDFKILGRVRWSDRIF